MKPQEHWLVIAILTASGFTSGTWIVSEKLRVDPLEKKIQALMSSETKPITQPDVLTRKVFDGGFLLGVALVWAENNQMDAVRTNYRLAHQSLTASGEFSDMELANTSLNIIEEVQNQDIGNIQVKLRDLYYNLSGQLSEKGPGFSKE